MENYSNARNEPVEGTWEREARRLRRQAAERGVVLDEERLVLYDVRELMALRHRLEAVVRPGNRRLFRVRARLAARP